MKILTRINERSWCEQFIRLRRFISSKATIINIFWHQNGITRRKYIYIYIKRFLSKYFSRWSIHLIRIFVRLFPRSFVTLCRRFFPRLSCRHLHLYRDHYPSTFFENFVYALFRNVAKFRWFENGIPNQQRIDWIFFSYRDFPPRSQNLTIFILIVRKFLSKNFKLLSVDHRLTITTRIYFSFVLKHSGNKFLPRIFQTSLLRAPK